MSKQLAFSSAVSIMVMALFVLYGPTAAQRSDQAPSAALPLSQLIGFKTLLVM